MKEISSLIFFGWLGVALIHVFQPARPTRIALVLILSLSYLYYCVSLPRFFAVIGWILIVYWLAGAVREHPKRDWIVAGYSIAAVFAFIFFKLGYGGIGERNALLEYAMPVGFSFILFHSIAFLTDIADRELSSRPPILTYLGSAFFFPTLTAGPFHKFQQLSDEWDADHSAITFEGYAYFCLGFGKFAVSGFLLTHDLLRGMPLHMGNPQIHALNLLFLGSVFLYVNFSGYSDMVVGFAKMMGFNVPVNFRFPFLAVSMADYWRSWHISLGGWFKEYVFHRVGYRVGAVIATFFTFLLIAFWHQISAKLLLYGLVNAALVFWFMPNNRSRWIGIPLTFILVLAVNALFLSKDLSTYGQILLTAFKPVPDGAMRYNLGLAVFGFGVLALACVAEYFIELLGKKSRFAFSVNFLLCILLLYIGFTLGIGRTDSVYVGY